MLRAVQISLNGLDAQPYNDTKVQRRFFIAFGLVVGLPVVCCGCDVLHSKNVYIVLKNLAYVMQTNVRGERRDSSVIYQPLIK